MSRELVSRLSGSLGPNRERLGSVTNYDAHSPGMDVRRNIYRSSHLGQNHGVRQMGTELGRPARSNERKADVPLKSVETGQNRPSAGFQEPSSRKYNPFG